MSVKIHHCIRVKDLVTCCVYKDYGAEGEVVIGWSKMTPARVGDLRRQIMYGYQIQKSSDCKKCKHRLVCLMNISAKVSFEQRDNNE